MNLGSNSNLAGAWLGSNLDSTTRHPRIVEFMLSTDWFRKGDGSGLKSRNAIGLVAIVTFAGLPLGSHYFLCALTMTVGCWRRRCVTSCNFPLFWCKSVGLISFSLPQTLRSWGGTGCGDNPFILFIHFSHWIGRLRILILTKSLPPLFSAFVCFYKVCYSIVLCRYLISSVWCFPSVTLLSLTFNVTLLLWLLFTPFSVSTV